MATNAEVKTDGKKRHSSYLRACCPDQDCLEDIYTLHDRVEMMDFEALFAAYIHKDKHDEIVTTFPNSKKFSEFIYDFADYNVACWCDERYITSDEVTHLGRGKIQVYWRVLDKYGARYDRRGYTRNIVDVQVLIPSLNLRGIEHFCYRYMSRRTASPQQVVANLLRQAVARLYNRFFVFEGDAFAALQLSFRCTTGKCCHNDAEEVPIQIKNMIPDWYYARTYPADTSALVVSVT